MARNTLLICVVFFLSAGCAGQNQLPPPRQLSSCRGSSGNTGEFQTIAAPGLRTVLWKKADPYLQRNRTASCIVVGDDAIFYTDNRRAICCRDRTSGALRWDFWHDDHRATTPPLVGDRAVYFGTALGGLFALDKQTGRILWQHETKKSWFEPLKAPVTTDLAIQGNLLFYGNDKGYVYAFDLDSLSLKWKFKTNGAVGSPALNGEVLYFSGGDGYLYALKAGNGKEQWRIRTKGKIASAPVAFDRMVLFRDTDGGLVAVQAVSGALEWNFAPLARGTSAPAVSGDSVFFGDEEGNIFALHAGTGVEKWRMKAAGGVFSGPLVAGGRLFLGTADRAAYVINADTGEVIEQYETNGKVEYLGLGNDFTVIADSGAALHALSGSERGSAP